VDVHPEVSDLASQATVQGGMHHHTTMADTRVMVNDGETAVIGGLIRSNESTLKRGIPCSWTSRSWEISSAPQLDEAEAELLIFVSRPRIPGDTASRSKRLTAAFARARQRYTGGVLMEGPRSFGRRGGPSPRASF